MALTTYSALTSAIEDFLLRPDLTATIPTFVELAEARLNRDLRVRQMIKRSQASLDTQFTLLPTDFLEAQNFEIVSTAPTYSLEPVTLQTVDRYRSATAAPGRPKVFAVAGNTLEVAPSPDATYTGELVYYSKIPALSVSNASNWLLLQAPDVYLYGSLLHSAPYLRDDERVALWSSLYNEAVGALKLNNERSTFAPGVHMRGRRLG
ncbi:MAG: phage adaptor protein [Candidatus Limnocylindrus sp.]